MINKGQHRFFSRSHPSFCMQHQTDPTRLERPVIEHIYGILPFPRQLTLHIFTFSLKLCF